MKTKLIPLLAILSVSLIVNNASCQTKGGQKKIIETFTGTFESKMGVMTSISCYCFEAGYVNTDDNEEIPVCFEKMKIDKTPDCKRIKVTGYFKEKEISPEVTSPCPAGTKKLFYVEEFECL